MFVANCVDHFGKRGHILSNSRLVSYFPNLKNPFTCDRGTKCVCALVLWMCSHLQECKTLVSVEAQWSGIESFGKSNQEAKGLTFVNHVSSTMFECNGAHAESWIALRVHILKFGLPFLLPFKLFSPHIGDKWCIHPAWFLSLAPNVSTPSRLLSWWVSNAYAGFCCPRNRIKGILKAISISKGDSTWSDPKAEHVDPLQCNYHSSLRGMGCQQGAMRLTARYWRFASFPSLSETAGHQSMAHTGPPQNKSTSFKSVALEVAGPYVVESQLPNKPRTPGWPSETTSAIFLRFAEQIHSSQLWRSRIEQSYCQAEEGLNKRSDS